MRVVLSAILTCLPAAGFAANADCEILGNIVNDIVAERQGGAAVEDAMLAVAEDYTGNKERFHAGIPPLAEWVYSLPEDQLADGVGAAYQAACESQ